MCGKAVKMFLCTLWISIKGKFDKLGVEHIKLEKLLNICDEIWIITLLLSTI